MNLTVIPFEREKRAYLFLLGVVFVVFFGFATAPPSRFPTGSIVAVPAGAGLHALAQMLEEKNVIRSPFWFRATAIILRGERGMKAGQYYLPHPQNTFSLAWRISRGDYQIETVKLTVPEGFTAQKISALFSDKFPFFDNQAFEALAPEGYLFPDTYFVPVTATATSTIKLMRDNFIRKIFPIMPEVEKSGKDLAEIVTLASLIEGEANNQQDREIVSDVLWKRLKLDMPLQVDVEMETYEFAGLPQAPINNPGLFSIQAALHPTSTPYYYYLTDGDGKMHYARTFDEHQANIGKYLR